MQLHFFTILKMKGKQLKRWLYLDMGLHYNQKFLWPSHCMDPQPGMDLGCYTPEFESGFQPHMT